MTPWRLFGVQVRRVRRLSPTFVRVTFTGDDLDRFADNGYDQRIKLVLPVPGRGLADLPAGPDWYARWRDLPEQRRPPVRTFTVRAVCPAAREVDVDFVRHGESGPASRWAGAAAPGDEAALVGPDAGWPGEHGGVEFRPRRRRRWCCWPATRPRCRRWPRSWRGCRGTCPATRCWRYRTRTTRCRSSRRPGYG